VLVGITKLTLNVHYQPVGGGAQTHTGTTPTSTPANQHPGGGSSGAPMFVFVGDSKVTLNH
jgi:hypothetical protein